MADDIFTDSEGKIIRTSSMKDEHQLVKITEKSPNVQNIGKIVRGDTNSNIITFEINRYYDNVDLYSKNIRFIVKNGNGIFTEEAVNLQYNDSLLRFSWILSYAVTAYSGNVTSAIEFYGADDSGNNYSLKTMPFSLKIEETLDATDITVTPPTNWFVDVENRLSSLENGTITISTDTTLTMSGAPADAKIVGDKLVELEENIVDSTQADWEETDETNGAYIKNKPTIPSVSNDLTDELKENYDNAVKNSYHENRDTLDKITESEDGSLLFDGNTIKGDSSGKSAYEIAIDNGFEGSEEEWLESLEGTDGESAYEIWLSLGNTGTEQDFINSLKSSSEETGSTSTTSSVSVEQKIILNATNGDTKYFTNSKNKIEGLIVQPYKFVEGDTNVIEVLKSFDNAEEENFNCNSDNIDFNDTEGMKIEDTYEYTNNEEYSIDGLFISETINLDEFKEIDSIKLKR